MKKSRSLLVRSLSIACFVAFGLGTIAAHANPGAQEANSTWVMFSPSEGLRASDAASILSKRLDLRPGIDDLRPAFDEKPGNGLEIQRFNQYFKGIHVAHGSYVLASKDGVAAYAFGKFFRLDASTSITPVLSESQALNKALQSTGASQYAWQADPKESMPKGALVFVSDFSSGAPDGKPRLAYAFDVYATEPMSRDMVYVDAQNGNILLRDAIMKHVAVTGKSLYSDTVSMQGGFLNGKYVLHDSTRGNGIFTYDVMNSTPSGYQMLTNPSVRRDDTSYMTFFRQDPAVDAHWGAEKVYDYWKNLHSRNSWDGNNGALYSFVHYGVNYLNAMWNGSAMVYGDGGGGYGAFTTLDICGHEIGHGVCQSTAGLVYQGESGGMNEGFSDIWGALIENYGNPHEHDAVPKNMWLIGEELGHTLRDMSNPKSYGQPNTYLGQNWIYTGSGCDNQNDHCGVHTTSGVLNYWFYLLTQGGKGTNDIGNNYQVAGIGTVKSGAIAYATELSLNSTSNYASARAASIAAATTLYGTCSPELEAVTRAWYAVGVGSNYTACKPEVSFAATGMSVDENANANGCTANHVVTVPVVLSGPAPTGGTATVTITAVGGTAVAGVDYDFTTTTLNFGSGATAAQTVNLKIYDNGYQAGNKYVDLALALSANGSTLTQASVMDTIRVTLVNDDRTPQLGTSEYHAIGSISSTADESSPFMSSRVAGRGQYIYTASELAAGSLRAGAPITELSYFITQKGSTQPFTGYTVKMGLTNQTSFSNAFLNDAGFTTVYSGNYTTKSGWTTIPFSTPFIWDGTSNIVVQVCFTNTGTIGSTDIVNATGNGSSAATAWGLSNGCSLSLTPSNISYDRPVVRFTQNVPPTDIATHTGDNRSWNVAAGNAVYFYTQPNNEIIATIVGSYHDMGCVTASVVASGNGFQLTPSGKYRSLKEFELSSAAPSASLDTFDALFYFNNDELGGVSLDDIYLCHTTASNYAGMNTSNTDFQKVTNFIFGQNWTAFRGTFYGFGHYFLTNGADALSTGSVQLADNALWTGANPFRDAPVLHWNLNNPEQVHIRIYDITGKTVYSSDARLDAGTHSLELHSRNDYAPGSYILQVVRPGSVFSRQMLKQ